MSVINSLPPFLRRAQPPLHKIGNHSATVINSRMAGVNKNTKLRFKAMMNKEKSKVLFAEADSDFADIWLSFLTLPLGRIFKILEKEYGDKAPAIGSLSNLYRSLANLDGKETTLHNPRSSFEAEYQRLKLNIYDSSSHANCTCGWNRNVWDCEYCVRYGYRTSVVRYGYRTSDAWSGSDDDGVYTLKGTSFVISDDLQIFPSKTGLFRIMRTLGITDDMDEAEQTLVEFGLSEVTSLLKASLTSSTPLSDVILKRTKYSANILESQLPIKSPPEVDEEFAAAFTNSSLKVTIQRSTGKVVHAQANEGFIDFLYGIFSIPLGKPELILGDKTRFKAINSLYRSAAEFIDDKYFKKGMKGRLMYPNFLKNTKGPLLSEQRQRDYQVMDDLTVALVPFSVMSMISALKEQKIAISDVEEVELQLGWKELFKIVKASLSSTTVLTDALKTHVPNKRVKKETWV